MVLTDAYYPGQYGGTGRSFDWSLLDGIGPQFREVSTVLAGGLTPSNVAEAIQRARPHAVDSASGVESQAGVKDIELVNRFVAEAMSAFSSLAEGESA